MLTIGGYVPGPASVPRSLSRATTNRDTNLAELLRISMVVSEQHEQQRLPASDARHGSTMFVNCLLGFPDKPDVSIAFSRHVIPAADDDKAREARQTYICLDRLRKVDGNEKINILQNNQP
jgi:hypothetical protein